MDVACRSALGLSSVWSDCVFYILTTNIRRLDLLLQSCTQRNGNYLKNLTIVEQDLSKICLVDNSPVSYALNHEKIIIQYTSDFDYCVPPHHRERHPHRRLDQRPERRGPPGSTPVPGRAAVHRGRAERAEAPRWIINHSVGCFARVAWLAHDFFFFFSHRLPSWAKQRACVRLT
ncbi:hypothetical protein BC938DRAFT_482107 [Jimgerdemannia flammicorona]|uniref:FCP1 homology domain-containing protein n=1 Tax=Jimgerdemannia flammicorona TaxID=994334 RepID=A0A433QEK9_9FUNG|nr:hypothetical protein BC938DRAFT_482107 [Jimgerdemannia flammicorona]